MAVGHHFVYFPPQVGLSQLLPDGTDVLHAPGKPFNRRLWAGGKVKFPPEGGPLLNGRRAVCVEGIRGAEVRGRPGQEKVFVNIERRIATTEEEEDEESVRTRIWRDDENETGSAVIERRDLVFLRDRQTAEYSPPVIVDDDKAHYESRIVKCA
jgi:hydroxyacyl-ACP dehydratase HTD2-like protein with hotdog domain